MSYALAHSSLFFCSPACTPDEWSGHGFLGVPKTPVDIPDAEIILTGLHWCGNGSVSPNDVRLITTYRHHGIQCVILCCSLCQN